VAARSLDPTEVYYELVDRIWPTNIVCLLEFAEPLDVARVTEAWATVCAQVPITGARVERTSPREARLVFADVPPAPVASYADAETAMAAGGSTHIDLAAGPLARCALVDDRQRPAVVLSVHHAALDGRPITQLGLLLARVLAGETDLTGHPLTRPTLPLKELTAPERDWSLRRTEMVATARAIRADEGFVGNAEPLPWHDAGLDAERDLCFVPFQLSAEESRGLIRWAKASNATVYGALAAAVMETAAALTPGLGRIGLSTAVDLGSRALPALGGIIGSSAAVIAGSYGLREDPAAMAREVSDDVRHRIDRGEGELFFALSGAERLPVGDATDGVVRRWTAGSAATICVSNIGVVAGEAPPSLRGLTIGLAPTPNQVSFIVATTFGDRLHLGVGMDRSRLSVSPERFAATLRDRLSALAR